jgi:enoyl-[acyl-carrier protein] reductase I
VRPSGRHLARQEVASGESRLLKSQRFQGLNFRSFGKLTTESRRPKIEEHVTDSQKTAVVFGLANKRSIAWAIAQKLQEAGWRLAITYQNERLEQEAKDLIADLPGAAGFMCDVSSDEQIAKLFEQLKEKYGTLQGIVHSVAFAPAEELKGEFVNTSREGFRIAHDISVYSLVAVSRVAAPLMTEGGSIVTMSYFGAEKVVPRYNVMGVAKAALEASVRYLASDLGPKGIRVNAISAGPIKTLAARGISNLGDMLKAHADRSPLRRNVDPAEVGGTAAFLLSSAGSGITGETIYVDCGYNIMGF